MKKRYLLLLLVFICFLFGNASYVRAKDNVCSINSTSSKVMAGDEVVVNFTLHDMDINSLVKNGYVELGFDKDVIDFVGVSSVYKNFNYNISPDGERLVLTLDSSDGFVINNSDDIVLASLKFIIKEGVENQTTKIIMYGLTSAYVGDGEGNNSYCKQSGSSTLLLTIYDSLNDANLSYLTIDEGTLSPEFSKDTTVYNVDVDYTVRSLRISGKCSGEGCRVTGFGSKGLKIGKTTAKIVVTAGNGITKEYYIVINRAPKEVENPDDGVVDDEIVEDIPEEIVLDDNANLKTLGVSSGTLSPVFSKNVLEYRVSVNSDIKSVKLSGICEGIECTVIGTGKKYLSEGENTYDIVVVAEDGTEKIYTINIYREYGLYLKNLNLKGHFLNPRYSRDVLEYELDVNSDINELDIVAEANDSETSIYVVGNSDFKVGKNIVDITLTSGDKKESKTYTIVVNKAISKEIALGKVDKSGKFIWDNGYVLALGIVLGVILLGLAGLFILYLIRKKYKKGEE